MICNCLTDIFSRNVNEASLFTRCSLLVKIHSLLFTRCKITRYSLQKSLVTRCKNRSLLVAKNHLLLVAEVARCKIHSSLVVKKTRELMFI